ncbi:NADH dehydrogenase [Planctomycetales bacterium]|nr:NADH dehydrogenase [Planctomycetales bacterium]
MTALLSEQLAQAGVVGAGGAGFPTHIKLTTGKPDTLIVNAAECEPLLHKDKEIVVHYTEQFFAGLTAAAQFTNVENVVIGIKKKYADVIDVLQQHLPKNKLSGKPHFSIAGLDDVYPSGDEFILVYETLHRVIPPGGLPIAVGAVVMNVETVYNTAAAWNTEGNNPQTKPVIEKFISIAGDVLHPCTLRVPVGIKLSECIAAAGGTTTEDPAFVVGGAMMGYVETNLNRPVTKTTGGIIVLPKSHFIVQRKLWDWQRVSRVGKASCDQCSFCTELCPRRLLGHPIEPHRAMRSLGFNLSRHSDVPGTVFCCSCNLCSYYSCPEGLDPQSVCGENKQRILAEQRQSGKRWENPPFVPERAEKIFPNRKTPTSRLIQKIGLSSYKNKAPLNDKPIETNEVEILLRQHIGAPCVPVVKTGENVSKGQPIAVRPETDGKKAMGVDIHSSIDGKVIEITAESIRVRA